MKKKRFVVLSGAGMSAESGLKTFRDSDGLWEGYRVEEVATPEAWESDPRRVLKFYNERRAAVRRALPNRGHLLLAQLERYFDVYIITQNVDDLHERAGSSKVLHLHGEILKSRSTLDENLIYPIEGESLNLGETCELGAQLRPHIVWFGEAVPMMDEASALVRTADYFLVIGTSLAVYPAAALTDYTRTGARRFLIDPRIPAEIGGYELIQEGASKGVELMFNQLSLDIKL